MSYTFIFRVGKCPTLSFFGLENVRRFLSLQLCIYLFLSFIFSVSKLKLSIKPKLSSVVFLDFEPILEVDD